MPTIFEKTWHHLWNYTPDLSNTTNHAKNMAWFFKAFLCGQLPTYYDGAGVGSAGPPAGAWSVLYSAGLTNNAATAGASTTIAAGSDGAALPQATINVASTTNFPQGAGFFWVLSSAGPQLITYTGVSGGNQFTGCSGGTGTLHTSQNVYDGIDRWSPNTTIAAGSNGQSLPQATINVPASGITGWPASGKMLIYTSAGPQLVTYTGRSGTTFTGCSGGTGTMTTGGLIIFGDAATNTWNSTDFPGNIIQAAAGSNHSWVWMVSPSALGPVYVLIDMNSSTINNFSVGWAFTAPTGGTITNRPTSTDEVQVANWQNQPFSRNTTTHHIHGSLTTDGMFTIFDNDSAANTIDAGWVFQKLADTKSADLYPWVMFYTWVASGAGPWDGSGQWSSTGNWGARNFNGAAILASLAPYAPVVAGANNVMGNSPNMNVQDMTDGLCGDHPFYMFNNAVGAYTLKGRLYDLRGAPCKLAMGFAEPTPTAPLSVTFGGGQLGVWLPTYAVPVF